MFIIVLYYNFMDRENQKNLLCNGIPVLAKSVDNFQVYVYNMNGEIYFMSKPVRFDEKNFGKLMDYLESPKLLTAQSELKKEILEQFGTVKQYCDKFGADRGNLSKILNHDGNPCIGTLREIFSNLVKFRV